MTLKETKPKEKKEKEKKERPDEEEENEDVKEKRKESGSDSGSEKEGDNSMEDVFSVIVLRLVTDKHAAVAAAAGVADGDGDGDMDELSTLVSLTDAHLEEVKRFPLRSVDMSQPRQMSRSCIFCRRLGFRGKHYSCAECFSTTSNKWEIRMSSSSDRADTDVWCAECELKKLRLTGHTADHTVSMITPAPTQDTDFPCFKLLKLGGVAPSARFGLTLTNMGDGQLYLFGGGTGKPLRSEDNSTHIDAVFNDLHVLDLEKKSWTMIDAGTAGGGGGGGGGGAFEEKQSSSSSSTGSSQRQQQPQNCPCARLGHTATRVGKRLFIFGGGKDDGSENLLNDLFIFNTAAAGSAEAETTQKKDDEKTSVTAQSNSKWTRARTTGSLYFPFSHTHSLTHLPRFPAILSSKYHVCECVLLKRRRTQNL